LPSAYNELVQALEEGETDLNQLAERITVDAAMTAKILQLVNSSFFGTARQISSLPEALSLLGLETLRGLVLLTNIFAQSPPHVSRMLAIKNLAEHSWRTGEICREIAQSIGATFEEAESARTSGLLHDIGKLALATNFPDEYTELLAGVKTGKSLQELEQDAFGADHAEIGAYLLGLWSLPDSVVEAVRWHHEPSKSPEQSPPLAGCLHLANFLASDSSTKSISSSPLNEEYLIERGLNAFHRPE
jgi:putative nucleotidyltransferase with HDIG domain